MTSIQMLPPDVLIVGAGPVGLTSALSLLREDIPLRIIDSAQGPSHDFYACLLHSSTLAILDKLGVYKRLLPYANRIDSMGLYIDRERTQTISLKTQESAYPHILAIPQNTLESILIEELALGGVEVEWGSRLTDLNSQESEVSGSILEPAKETPSSKTEDRAHEFHVPFLLGADGYRSRTRDFTRTGFCEAKSSRSYAIFEFKVKNPLDEEMKLIFHQGLISAFIPLSSRHYRCTFELDHPSHFLGDRQEPSIYAERFQKYPLLGPDHLHALIRERAPFFHYELTELDCKIEIPFADRLASSFTHGRVCLLGDAAHTTSPIGVQSLNGGLREAYDLSQAISTIQHGNCPFSLLQSWGHRSHERWRWLLGLNTELLPLQKSDPRLMKYTRQILNSLPVAPENLPELSAQIGFKLTAREASTISFSY